MVEFTIISESMPIIMILAFPLYIYDRNQPNCWTTHDSTAKDWITCLNKCAHTDDEQALKVKELCTGSTGCEDFGLSCGPPLAESIRLLSLIFTLPGEK